MKLDIGHLGRKVRLHHMDGYFVPMAINGSSAFGDRFWTGGHIEHATSWKCDDDWMLYSPAPKGLSLLEAMESGKRFKFLGGVDKEDNEVQWFRVGENGYVINEYGDEIGLDTEVLTARYELEIKKAEVTAAFIDACYERWSERTFNPAITFVGYLKKELGL